jgi:hypothetical protein
MPGWDRLAAEYEIEGLLTAMGGSRKLSAVGKFGANFGINTNGVPCSLTTAVANVLYPYPTGAESLEILSSVDADDDSPGGTGLRTLEVQGLDADWKFQTQEVALNGQSVVAVPGTWIRTFRMIGLTAGVGLKNAGTITLRPLGGGLTRLNIPPLYSQTMHCLFTIPDGFVGFFKAARVNTLPSVANPVSYGHAAFVTRENDIAGRPFRVRNTAGLPINGRNVVPMLLPSKTDIEIQVLDVDKNASQVAGTFQLLLRAKEETRHYLPNIID